MSEGIRHCGGSWEFYVELLGDYTDVNKAQEIHAAYQRGDQKNYEILVHALKSISRTIGAEQMGEYAYTLELAAKEGNKELIRQRHGEIMEYYDILQNRIREWLDGASD